MVHAHPWLKILSFSRFPSFRFRPKPSFSPYKTRFSFLYPPIALSHKFRSSFHSFFLSDFLCTFLRDCSCSSFYLLFSYSLSTCYFSRFFFRALYYAKRSYQRRSILCIMTSIFLLNLFALMLIYDCKKDFNMMYRQPPYNTIFLQHNFNIFNIITSYGIKQYFSIFDILIR